MDRTQGAGQRNISDRGDNGRESDTGASLDPTRDQEFTYNDSDQLIEQIDRGPTAAGADDRRITSSYYDTGWQKDRVVAKSAGSGAWDTKQTAFSDYFDNGKLKSLDTKNGSGAVLESHAVSYDDGSGQYVNGNRTKDVFHRLGPDTGAPCRDAQNPCTTTYVYDANERVVEEKRDRGSRGTKTTTYELYPDGNIWHETRDGVLSTFEYDGQQLTKLSRAGQIQKYFYDPQGNLDCITDDLGDRSKCSPGPQGDHAHLWADYTYDLLNRMTGFRSWLSNGDPDRDSSYRYDAFDRVMSQTTAKGSGPQRTTSFGYLGMSDDLAQEQHYAGADTSGSVQRTKTYSYDSGGHRITMTDQRSDESAARTYNYGFDAHGSVSLLVSDAGAAKASYGYTAYGESDDELTQEKTDQQDDPNTPQNESVSTADDPVNPFRYGDKRLDEGSGTLEMGVRRFGPDVSRFLQRDVYDDALSDLSLSTDPLSANRYSLAGGNPVSFVEADGHTYQRETVWTRDGTTSTLGRATSHNAGLRRQQNRQQRFNRYANAGIRQAWAGASADQNQPSPVKAAILAIPQQAQQSAEFYADIANDESSSGLERGFATFAGSLAELGTEDHIGETALTLSSGGEAVLAKSALRVAGRARAGWKFGDLPNGVLGSTDEAGNITIARGLKGRQLSETVRHESVHSALSAKRGPLLGLRQRIGVGAYQRSNVLRYAEEALAEGYATGSVVAGLRFPVRAGYVSRRGLAAEVGAAGAGSYGAFELFTR